MAITIIGFVGAFAGLLSAWWWFRASRLPAVYPMAYLSGPPKDVADNVDLANALNARAAIAAGIAVGCQAVLLLLGALHVR